MTAEGGVLYVVATPIGNLADLSTRAVEILRNVQQIYAEDTRHSAMLMNHHGIATPLRSLHEHNEEARVEELTSLLRSGASLALVSDAGTPLISDPGYKLVRALRERDCKIAPVPGACAMIAALSVAGLPTDRFTFEGFLPAKNGPRSKKLEALIAETRTMVFYEAPHRIEETLQACVDIFGAEREAVLAREITKTFETFLQGSLQQILALVQKDDNQRKGEIVLIISGAKEQASEEDAEHLKLLQILLAEVPLSQAVSIAEKLTGAKHKALYKLALSLKNS